MIRNELMLDIETTGQKPGCKVLSLGAFGFDKDGNQVEFYKRFNMDAQTVEGLADDTATMEWWGNQSELARTEAFGGKTDPKEGISEFKQWFYSHFSAGYGSHFRVWCCGLDFDFPILQEFFRRFGFTFPWKYWLQYDYRTIKNIFVGVKSHEGNVAKHTALEDAKAQMRGLRYFYQTFCELKNGI